MKVRKMPENGNTQNGQKDECTKNPNKTDNRPCRLSIIFHRRHHIFSSANQI
jgi:hypothetical protein